jgi:energy-coupling factor transporter ATP-binding protein EcfA2
VTPPASQAIHASCVLIGERAVLIRGPSGSGKSRLALALIAAAAHAGQFACLVADDRVRLARRGRRLLARPVAPLEGLIERRGLGLTPQAHEPAARIALLVDLGGGMARMPEPEDLVDELAGVTLPRLALTDPDPGTVLAALALFGA